ncbi:MAG: phosphatase PAP2 family protein [Chloroflexota bacterium]|nr:phosphatase PAP2 family protein [Chloroflexota bacterium]
MGSLDYAVFRCINGLAGQYPYLDRLAQLLVNDYFLPTLMSLVLIALWFSGATDDERRRNQLAVLRAVISLLLANALLKTCNLVYFRPRPFTYHEVNLLFYHPSDSSLPSNPAAVGFALTVAAWLHNRRAGTLLLVLATLFAVSRVYCGVHYPLDVIAGAGLGSLAAFLVAHKTHFLDPLLGKIIGLAQRACLA